MRVKIKSRLIYCKSFVKIQKRKIRSKKMAESGTSDT